MFWKYFAQASTFRIRSGQASSARLDFQFRYLKTGLSPYSAYELIRDRAPVHDKGARKFADPFVKILRRFTKIP